MKRILYLMSVCLLCGCSVKENMVSVRQVENKGYVVLRMRKDMTQIHSLLYPVSFEFKKNVRGNIYYFENSYFAKNEEICPGTAGCHIWSTNGNKDLMSSYKRFDGTIKYIIDKDRNLQDNMADEYKRMLVEKRDTIHVSLKEFKDKHSELVKTYFEGDSIILHFHNHKKWIDVPVRMSFE